MLKFPVKISELVLAVEKVMNVKILVFIKFWLN